MPSTARTGLSIENLEALYVLAAELLQIEEYEDLLDTLVRRALELLRADRGFLVLRRGDSERLDFAVVRGWSPEDELRQGREPVSRSVVAEVLRAGQPMVLEDALGDPRFAAALTGGELHRSLTPLLGLSTRLGTSVPHLQAVLRRQEGPELHGLARGQLWRTLEASRVGLEDFRRLARDRRSELERSEQALQRFRERFRGDARAAAQELARSLA